MELVDLYVTATVVCSNSLVKAMIIKKGATLVVDYGDPDPEDPGGGGEGSNKQDYDLWVKNQQLMYTDTISSQDGIPFTMTHDGTSTTNVDVTFAISSGSSGADN